MSDAGAGEGTGRPRSAHAAIVRELRDRFGAEPAGPAVSIYLAARGYDPGQIAAVLAELAGAPDAEGSDAAGPDDAAPAGHLAGTPAPAPLRVWGPHERARFTPDAWGRLLQLRAAGMGDAEFEHLIDRALLTLDGPVSPAELRALLGDALGSADALPETIH